LNVKNVCWLIEIKLYFLSKASFFDQFKNALNGADFNVEEIKKNKSLSIREKKGVSVNECARLCLKEPAFDCQSMSYEAVVGECKWSSLVGALADYVTNNPYLINRNGYTWYYSKLSDKFNYLFRF
jgi:hypothetical protein